jgi:WD40 repeat protein
MTETRMNSSKKRRLVKEEKELEDELFGGLVYSSDESENHDEPSKKKQRLSLEPPLQKQDKTAAVWHDEDDANMKIDLLSSSHFASLRKDYNENHINGLELEKRLQEKYTQIYSKPKWLQKIEQKGVYFLFVFTPNLFVFEAEKGSDDEDDEILKQTVVLTDEKPTKFRIQKLYTMPQDLQHDSIVFNIDFHPNGTLFCTCGADNSLKIFQITQLNTFRLIKSLSFKRFHIRNARFSMTGDEIIVVASFADFHFFSTKKKTTQKPNSHRTSVFLNLQLVKRFD